MVFHKVYTFCPFSFICKHWSGSRPLIFVNPHQDSSLVSVDVYVMKIPQLWICRTAVLLRVLQQFIDGLNVGIGQLKALDLGLGGR